MLRVLGVSTDVDRLHLDAREVVLGVFPMGIDARGFSAVASEPSVAEEVRALRGDPETRLLVGVDRLDYTKGIEVRLNTYAAMLERGDASVDKHVLMQVAVPSRESVAEYAELRDVAVPQPALGRRRRDLVAHARGWTGYTHQWREPYCDQRLRGLIMASADSVADRDAAQALGWRTFRVKSSNAPVLAGEIVCPASEEQGKRLTCEQCGACNGGGWRQIIDLRKMSIVIDAHGGPSTMRVLAKMLD